MALFDKPHDLLLLVILWNYIQNGNKPKRPQWNYKTAT